MYTCARQTVFKKTPHSTTTEWMVEDRIRSGLVGHASLLHHAVNIFIVPEPVIHVQKHLFLELYRQHRFARLRHSASGSWKQSYTNILCCLHTAHINIFWFHCLLFCLLSFQNAIRKRKFLRVWRTRNRRRKLEQMMNTFLFRWRQLIFLSSLYLHYCRLNINIFHNSRARS